MIELSAVCGDAVSQSTKRGLVIALEEPSVVTFTATVGAETELPTGITLLRNAEAVATAPRPAQGRDYTFRVHVDAGDTFLVKGGGNTSPPVRVTMGAEEYDTFTRDIGRDIGTQRRAAFDSEFARFAAFFLAFAIVLMVFVAWRTSMPIRLPRNSQYIGPNTGSFAQRATTRIVIIGMTMGGVVVAIGTYLAALESRQRRNETPPAETKTGFRGLLSRLARMPAVVAILMAGALIVFGSLIATAQLLNADPVPAPDDGIASTPGR